MYIVEAALLFGGSVVADAIFAIVGLYRKLNLS